MKMHNDPTDPGAAYPFSASAESAGGVASPAASDPRALAHVKGKSSSERRRQMRFMQWRAQKGRCAFCDQATILTWGTALNPSPPNLAVLYRSVSKFDAGKQDKYSG